MNIKLRNTTGGMAKVGALVRCDPKNPKAFKYVTDLSGLDVVGTIAQATPPGGLCTINLLGNNEDTTKNSPHITVSETPPQNPAIGDLWIQISVT